MHEHRMENMHLMHFMFYMYCMHVLYPDMHYMHGGINKRVKEKGKGCDQSRKLCTNQEINKRIFVIQLMYIVSQI